ncbi:MAG: hypothetical protein WCJ29_05480 [bacterium]
MQFVYSLATGNFWAIIALLELTSVIHDPFWFSPIRTAFIATIAVAAIVVATTDYLYQLWFARICAGLTLIFLILSYFFPFLPDNFMKIPYIVGFVLWIAFACIAGYEKKA